MPQIAKNDRVPNGIRENLKMPQNFEYLPKHNIYFYIGVHQHFFENFWLIPVNV